MMYLLGGQPVTREEWLQGAPGHTPGHPPRSSGTKVDFFQGQGRRYIGQLARFPNDPRAWVSSVSDLRKLMDVRAVEENTDFISSGVVKHKARGRTRAPKPDIALAQDIVDREVGQILAGDPGKKRSKVEEDVRNKRTPRYAK